MIVYYICNMMNENFLKESLIGSLAKMEALTKRSIPYSNSGVPGYLIKHWESKGIVPVVGLPNQNREYNIVDYIWVCLVRDLTSLGYPWDNIRKLMVLMLSPQCPNEYFKGMNSNAIESIKDGIWSKGLVEEDFFDKKRYEFSVFYLLVLTGFTFERPVSLLVNAKGEFMIEDLKEQKDNFYLMKWHEFKQVPHVCISLSKILSDVLLGLEPKKYLLANGVINEKELEVLERIRSGRYQEITVSCNKNGKIDQVVLQEVQKVSNATRIADLIASNGYHEIIVKTENGNVVHCVNKRKMK